MAQTCLNFAILLKRTRAIVPAVSAAMVLIVCGKAADAAESQKTMPPGNTNKLRLDPDAKCSEPVFNDRKGVWVCKVASPYQKFENDVEVLLPDKFDKGQKYRVLYVLPVESGIGGYFGDGLQEMRKAGVPNKYNLICATMAFDKGSIPWYGAHASDAKARHEDYILKVVVPLVESRYPTLETPEGRLLFGFSKSGWGAFSLILRNPNFFGYACSWDAPLMIEWPGNWGVDAHFGTKENFEKYRISGLFEKQAAAFKDKKRLVLLGESIFGKVGAGEKSQTVWAHERMDVLGIQHAYRGDLRFQHTWKTPSGENSWIKHAVEMLMEIAENPAAKR